MSDIVAKTLASRDCAVRAKECRRLASATSSSGRRVMLHDIAGTWDRGALDIELHARGPLLRPV